MDASAIIPTAEEIKMMTKKKLILFKLHGENWEQWKFPSLEQKPL
jgi:hypothetical protein